MSSPGNQVMYYLADGLERAFGNQVMYYLADGLERAFVKKELILIPEDTELPPCFIQKC